MARQKRVVYPGGIYHAMNRGNNGEWIFREDADKEMFLALLIAEIERCGRKLHEWALMDNHFHLLLETPEGNLSKAMPGWSRAMRSGFTASTGARVISSASASRAYWSRAAPI